MQIKQSFDLCYWLSTLKNNSRLLLSRERHRLDMVRELKGRSGGGGEGLSSEALLLWWGAIITLSIITALIFSCAGGASKDKASATHTDKYGSTCAGGCGGACGAWAHLLHSMWTNSVVVYQYNSRNFSLGHFVREFHVEILGCQCNSQLHMYECRQEFVLDLDL